MSEITKEELVAQFKDMGITIKHNAIKRADLAKAIKAAEETEVETPVEDVSYYLGEEVKEVNRKLDSVDQELEKIFHTKKTDLGSGTTSLPYFKELEKLNPKHPALPQLKKMKIYVENLLDLTKETLKQLSAVP